MAEGIHAGLFRTAPPYQRIDLPPHEHAVGRMGFSPNGQWLATFTGPGYSHGRLFQPSVTSVFELSSGQRIARHSNEDQDARTSQCDRGKQIQDEKGVGIAGDAALLADAARWLLDCHGQRG